MADKSASGPALVAPSDNLGRLFAPPLFVLHLWHDGTSYRASLGSGDYLPPLCLPSRKSSTSMTLLASCTDKTSLAACPLVATALSLLLPHLLVINPWYLQKKTLQFLKQ